MATALLAIVVGMADQLASEQPNSAAEATKPGKQLPSDWRYTARGWQRASNWRLARRNDFQEASIVHPVVIGLLELLISVGALVAFSADANSKSDGQPRRSRPR